MQQQQPDITRGTVIDTKPEMAGFMLPGTSSFAPPTDSMFRPINQAYMIQSPPSYQLSGPGSRGLHHARLLLLFDIERFLSLIYWSVLL
jgi:hypothetical protein